MAYVIAALIFIVVTGFGIGFPFLLWKICNQEEEEDEDESV